MCLARVMWFSFVIFRVHNNVRVLGVNNSNHKRRLGD